jgi:hypothetical protein
MCDMVDVSGYSLFIVHGIGCIFFPQTQPIYKSTGTAVKKIMGYKEEKTEKN